MKVDNYQPLNSIRKTKDFELPTAITLKGQEYVVPKNERRKTISYGLIGEPEKLERTAWISQSMAHILNAHRFTGTDVYAKELGNAYRALLKEVSFLVKETLLKDRKGPGFCAFVQANENVPEDCILISKRTYYEFLIPFNGNWTNISEVVVTRYPNLGPQTTSVLKVLIQDFGVGSKKTNEHTAYYQDSFFSSEEAMDGVYLHPKTLKNNFQGDGDGDTLFCVAYKSEGSTFSSIDLTRKAAQEVDLDLATLRKKSDRSAKEPLNTYLPKYFDTTPIGPATYIIRTKLFDKARELIGKVDHPYHKAWEIVSPEAIDDMEFVFDIRKGEFTPEQIEYKLGKISEGMGLIKKRKESGDWFCQTITSATLDDPRGFMSKFPNLQSFVDYIFCQESNVSSKA